MINERPEFGRRFDVAFTALRHRSYLWADLYAFRATGEHLEAWAREVALATAGLTAEEDVLDEMERAIVGIEFDISADTIDGSLN
jgi:hypothetical protein